MYFNLEFRTLPKHAIRLSLCHSTHMCGSTFVILSCVAGSWRFGGESCKFSYNMQHAQPKTYVLRLYVLNHFRIRLKPHKKNTQGKDVYLVWGLCESFARRHRFGLGLGSRNLNVRNLGSRSPGSGRGDAFSAMKELK